MTTEFDDLTRTTEERRKYFTLPWFRQLFRGQLSLGDTFWIGNFGVLLFVVPLSMFLALMFALADGANGQVLFWVVYSLAMAVYFSALTRSVFIAARKSPRAKGWRWAAVGYTALTAGTLLIVAGLVARGLGGAAP